jgi:hypothetical protein
MNKRIAPTVLAGAVTIGLAFGLTGCSDKPPADFAKRCKAVGGKTMRENDFENLGMAPMAFEIGGPKPAPKAKAPSIKKPAAKSPKLGNSGPAKKHNGNTSNGWQLAGGSHKSKTKKSKKHKADDNEWVCVKNGTELFDED